MDPKLLEASLTGNIPFLQSLLESDPSILAKVVLSSSNTPLHVACMHGHLNFVQEILKRRPDFAGDLNQDGFSPLHIASANGNTEIVKELLDLDQNMSLIVGNEGRIPLHNAVMKGKVKVVRQLLVASVDSIKFTTARGETAVHIAVRNNQFAAFKLLVGHAKQFNMEEVLNKKDNQRNTILHLAVSKRQYEVVDLLVGGKMVSKDIIRVNSLNVRGLTPLDVLQLFQSDAADREIEEILKRAGALKASNLTSNLADSSVIISGSTSDEQPPETNNQAQPQRSNGQINALSLMKAVENTAPDDRNILLIVAVFITTATYQAMLTPPGGLAQDGDHAGKSITALNSPIGYIFFIIFNTTGFFISLFLIYFLSSSIPFKNELYIGIVALMGTYDTCIIQSAPTAYIQKIAAFMITFLPVIIPAGMVHFRNR